jgi:transcriptional regulator with XRE-family HTH domain
MAGKKSELGPIGTNVLHAVARLREERRLSYAELSRRLGDLGRDIPPLGLRRIESGERRVDADDLIALALALEVSPLALLLPTNASSLVANGDRYAAERIWDWARGHQALTGDVVNFLRDSNPLEWPELEAKLRNTYPYNESVAAGILGTVSRNTARKRATKNTGRKVSRGDDQ